MTPPKLYRPITDEEWGEIQDTLRFSPPVRIVDECHRLKRHRRTVTKTRTEEESSD